MDGTGRRLLLLLPPTAWPNGMALDHGDRKLYLADAFSDEISSIDLVTNETKRLVKVKDAHIFSIDVVGSWLYATDWKTNHLHRMPKKGGMLEPFGPTTFTRLYGIKGFNSTEMFSGASICQSSACDQLCLPIGLNRFTCACADGYRAVGVTCLPEPKTPGTTTKLIATTEATSNESLSSLFTTVSDSSTQSTFATTSKNTDDWSTNIADSSSDTNIYISQTTNMPLSSTRYTTNSLQTENVTNFYIPDSAVTTERPIPEIASASSLSDISEPGVRPLHLVAVLVPLGLVVCVIVVLVTWRQRRHIYAFSHNRLLDEPGPDKFKVAAFSKDHEGDVTFDSGIENPGFDISNQPSTYYEGRGQPEPGHSDGGY